MIRRSFLALAALARLHAAGLEPRGEIHIPIGLPDSRDTLKTFVEAEGNFSPGFGSCGVAFWVFDPEAQRFFAPTQDDVKSERGFIEPGVLIPWTRWSAGDVQVRSEVCQFERETSGGKAQFVGARVRLTNTSAAEKRFTFYAVVTPKGPAGAPIRKLEVQDAVVTGNGHALLIAESKPNAAEAPAPSEGPHIEDIKLLPPNPSVQSLRGLADAALRYEVTLAPGGERTFRFLCPVLAGRRAAPHLWDGTSMWAQLDDADPILGSQGAPQPELPLEEYRSISVDSLFTDAQTYWDQQRGDVRLTLPDPRWTEAFYAIPMHVAMCLNEGAPDVAVINYNVFNRDGVYVANLLEKAGNSALAEKIADYFLQHPFNGRVQPEADNPGQILWLLGEHWLFTRDQEWLRRIWPSAVKLAEMIEYYRTTPEPHWVSVNGIAFGDQVPDGDRMRLHPGACDGHHPEYTEAFDLAGLRASALLATAQGDEESSRKWTALASRFATEYDQKFGPTLRDHPYANYCTLWPCRLYPLSEGRGFTAFQSVGAQEPKSWRYFPLALAHQGLLAGNRSAASGTLTKHLELPSMHGWYALDEGGPSAPGNWMKVETNWKVEANGPKGALSAPAMPHGWAIAEFHHLLRDALVFEVGGKLILFAGIPPEWFAKPMKLENLPTHFGKVSIEWKPGAGLAEVRISGTQTAPNGVIVRLPRGDYPVATTGEAVKVPLD